MRTLPAVACGLFALARPAPAAPPVDFNKDIRPVLATQCYPCHGPDEKARKADLRLDRRDDAFKAGAFVPGKPADSPLLQRITSTDPDEVMPPPKSKKPPLTPGQVELFKRWVAEGAKYGEHWAFAKLTRPVAPAVKDGGWGRTPIDRFVLARLEAEGLKPSPEADRVTLLRRLSFDLTGLPPTPEEIRAFVEDKSPDAYEKQVDRLLASPHYGERMTVWWLDLVRYADSIGYHSDNPMNVAPYRDYVIRAFNENTPFDRFTVEQLAGDLLPNPSVSQRVASAYNRLLQTTEEGGAQPKEYEAKYAADRVRNFGQVWLGGTLMCAECHDHKFDPYTQKDFYSVAAFFADVQEASVGRREDGMRVATPDQDRRLKDLTDAAAKAETRLTARGAVVPVAVLKADRDAAAAAAKARDEFDKTIPRTLVTTAATPRTVRVLKRGNWQDESGPVVTPNTPGFLPPLGKTDGRPTRLDLARWTVSPDNPLTARVTVNRLWKLAFGRGIARSLEESGTQGELPTHPELLDWLANEFRQDWDVKHLLRLIVTSAAYRQSSAEPPALRERDPRNDRFARQARFRLDAEFVRDNALAVGGLLNRTVGGPSVKPYQPPGYWSALNFPTREWQKDQGEAVYRRGLYTHWQRTFPHPAMVAFDAPSREECTCDRPRSNVPQQALTLLNDPEFVEAAKAFAAKALADGGADDAARVGWAFRRATGRDPKPAEAEVLLGLLAKHRKEYAADGDAAKKLLAVGDLTPPKDVPAGDLAAWASVCRVVLNLHETITRP
ncbi:MAG: PSD1 and planctomycete cytochrome C domain-containing protein [Gemmataceae bacterium]|nr:PSD1 and planctomycete cytochrome C domain-containing protein [Gemmataceae bacterium]